MRDQHGGGDLVHLKVEMNVPQQTCAYGLTVATHHGAIWCSQTNQTWANGHAASYLCASERGLFLGQLTRHRWVQRSRSFLFEHWEFARFAFSRGGRI